MANTDKLREALADARRRLNSAERDEDNFSREIRQYDDMATLYRKRRQLARAKKDRARAAIQRYEAMLDNVGQDTPSSV